MMDLEHAPAYAPAASDVPVRGAGMVAETHPLRRLAPSTPEDDQVIDEALDAPQGTCGIVLGDVLDCHAIAVAAGVRVTTVQRVEWRARAGIAPYGRKVDRQFLITRRAFLAWLDGAMAATAPPAPRPERSIVRPPRVAVATRDPKRGKPPRPWEAFKLRAEKATAAGRRSRRATSREEAHDRADGRVEP